MKETIKKTLSILLALLMLTSVLPLKGIELPDFGIKARAAENGNESTAEDSVVDSGSCGADGSDVHWTFYESGKLVISGTGAMEDYDFDEPPVRDTDNPPEEPLTEEPLTEEPSTDGAVPSPVSAVESAAVAEDSEHGEKSVKLSIGSIAAAFAQKSPLAVLNDGEASGDAEVEPYSEDGSDSAVPDPEQPTEPTEEVKKKTPWFDYTYRVKEVVVEEGITHIGDLAFAFFVELTKISLPQSLIGIGIGSFAYCFKLESIPLPENLEEIGNTAFFSALSVKVLDLPQSLKKLGGAAFGYLMSVEKLEYPGGSVETDEAEPPFYCMTGLKELVIPEDAVVTDNDLEALLETSPSLKTVKNYSDTIALSEKMTMFQDYEAAQKYSVFVKAQYSYAIQFEAGVGNGISSEKQFYEYIINAVNEEFGTVYTTADTNMLSEEIEPVGAGVAPYVALYCKETSAEHEACRTNGYMHYLVETDAPCSCNMSGTLDSGLEWAVNAETKTLTFSGSGDIADYDLTQGNIPPYSRFAAVIENVEFADGVNISEAGDFAFSCLENVKTLSLPEGITVFGECTFYKSGYEVLNLPASFQYLNSFIMGNNKLRTVNVADGNELYESVNGALYMRATGEDGTVYRYLIKMPETSYAGGFAENVASVFFGAMERYSQTPEIRFPDTVGGIFDGAIFNSNVTSVYIGAGQIQVGDTVKQMSDDSIDEDFAYNCNHLEEISVNPENPAFTSVDGVLCNKAVTKIVRCPVAKTGFVIPQTVTEIGYDAFDNCVMPQIDLPENVAVVGNCAFDSDWLEKIAVRNASCDISDSCTLGNTETVVYGHLGSTAEVSADKHRQRFVSFDNVEIVGITLDTSKVKTRYTVGEKLDTTGLVVYGDYSDGTCADKTAYVSFGWFDSSAPGTYTVEVRYKDFTASYDVTVEAALDYKTGDIIEFGSYPQSEVTDAALKSALTSKAGSTDGWTSYDYYISGEQSDFMKYADVEYGGEKYRGVYFTQYRPFGTIDPSSTDNSYQDDNGYNTFTVYWFKYEPMKWQVLLFDKTTGNAMVLSKDIIDSQQYYNNRNNRTIGGKTVYSNNYEHSDIRAWLNGTFYDGAFTDAEKNAIIATTLDNSTRNVLYYSNSTTDKVWLLSYSEAKNTAYGFTSNYNSTETRQAKGSAYALCQGLNKYSLSVCSNWRLRSAGEHYSRAYIVGSGGYVNEGSDVYNSNHGVRPALKINLTSCDHVWQEEVISPTCTERGYTLHTCTKCGAEYRDNYTAPLGHTPDGGETTVVAPTCTENGCTVYTCSVCGEKYNDTYTDALGHDWDEGTVTDPTCTSQGYTAHNCTRCGSTTRDTYTDALGHDWAAESVRVEPTCTETGYTRRECTRCDVLKNIKWDAKYASSHPYSDNAEDEYTFSYPGAESIELVFNADTQFERYYDSLYIYDGSGNLVGKYSDNELSSRKVVINGDAFKLKLTSDGSVTRYGFEIESITVNVPASMDAEYTILPALGHDWDEGIITPPTCTEQGYTKHNCTRCSETMCDTYVAPLGHDWDEGTVTDPTCTSQGYTKHRCTRCDSITYDTYIDALGHDWDEGTVNDPTCTSQGYTKHRCTRCDSITYDTYTDPLGHDWSTEWTVDEPVSCTKNGSKSHHCTRCDAKNDVTVISCPGHDYGEFETVKEPTCTDKGSKKKVCANCNDTVYEDIPALGHNWATEWTVDVPVTCTSDGSKSRHCLRCDAKTDVLSLTSSGHAFGEWVTEKAADCTKDGLETRKCATCGAVEKKVIEKLGHDYPEYTVTKATTVLCEGEERAECARCGNIDVRVIPKIQIDTDSNKNYGFANFTVVNAQTKEPIKGANLFISTENDGENTFVTDENGKVGIVLPIGRQTVSAYADGCLTRNLKINIQSGTNEIPLIGLSSKKTYDVEVNHHLMTKEEIEEAGIDTDAPENNHVFKYEVTFEFEPEIDWLSIFYYMNGNGDILGGGSGGSGGGSGGSGGGSGYGGAWYGDGGGKGHFRAKNEKTGEVVNVYPVSEYFYLIIRGEVRWLKEMFDVEMLVVNNSETDTLEDLSAELELPDGLSLATMKGEQQTLKKELENVAEGKTTSAHWYVRGDKAGSYEIAASLKGTVMPFEEEINDVFKAKNALQVWAGNALHLDFEVPSSAYYAKDYPIKITLTNVSDITLYNVSHYITGIEQSRVTYYSDGKVEKEIYMKKDTNIGEFVTEFNPGDKIVIELSVNIMFQSKLMEYRLNQLIGKVDRIEQLIKAFKAIKTGLDIADGLISAIGSASKAVDSFISSASAELAEKVTLARDLKSALVDFEMAYSKFENKTVDAAVKLTNSAVGASLKAFTQEPDEWLKKTSVKDIKKLISGVKTLGNSLSGQPSKAEIKKFNVFDSIRTLISAIPIVFTLKNVFLVEDEDNTTSIPWSCTVTQSGPEYFGVANLSRHLSNILIAGSSDLIKGMLPSYIFLIPGANSALSAEDAKREIIAVEKEITRFKARSASGDVTYKAYVVRNTQTQSMMLRSVSALSDGFILSSDNDTARFENGVLTFTGDGMIEVTPADLSGGTLVVEDSDGNKYEYEMTVVAQHECTPDEREVIISPTADNDGFAVDCCSVCGDVINVELLSAKECTHSYGEWVEDIAAVCNAEGLRHRDCTLCGYSESEVTEPTDRHVPGEWIIDREATCTETGEKHTVCSVCGTVSETAAIEKIAHTMTGWAVKTAATCTAEGVSERSCTECGYAETKPIAKTEHTSSGWIGISAATCTEDGERCMKCTVCGAVLKTEAVPAHGHADADKNGKCDNCGESLTSSCKHICHSKNKLAQFFWKMIRLMYKLFKNHEFCDCGVRHW
ncbi:MAG: leucine-rich repeat protein [Oscillospiraceae bacterium]|nr:leucine-rich repeat protein [Oscillospiraceae bacterium]